ncbi:MAG TPA: queuosine precursor transporter [Lachnospiraceae bacterium]|nr:queuosine precursor transporter [Lachnospiraceae bacterium]
MQNELILVLSLIVIFGSVVLAYRFFGTSGLYCFTAIATIAANIEVLIMVNAFGMEQTLGNILFASTFLITDILSEMEGKKAANKAVKIGIATSFLFILISQSWFLYIPNSNDWAMPAIKQVFKNTPRLMLVGIAVYAIVQAFDVWAYHKIWNYTSKKYKDTKRYLWIRNNGSTLISQLLNTVLFTFGAFIGIYDMKTLINIVISSYIIFIATSLLDTPFVYAARRYCKNAAQE